MFGLMVVVIGILLYITLPPTGYTHNPLTGLFRGLFICIIVFGFILLFVGSLPYIEGFVIGSGTTNMTNSGTVQSGGNIDKLFVVGK